MEFGLVFMIIWLLALLVGAGLLNIFPGVVPTVERWLGWDKLRKGWWE